MHFTLSPKIKLSSFIVRYWYVLTFGVTNIYWLQRGEKGTSFLIYCFSLPLKLIFSEIKDIIVFICVFLSDTEKPEGEERNCFIYSHEDINQSKREEIEQLLWVHMHKMSLNNEGGSPVFLGFLMDFKTTFSGEGESWGDAEERAQKS